MQKLEYIDRDIALENMVVLRDALKDFGLTPFLHYGTLLGAMRERDFIPYDDDVDMGLYGADRERLLQALPELERRGFSVGYIKDDTLSRSAGIEGKAASFRMIKLKRKDQEIDIFLAFKVRRLFGYRWDIDGRISLPYRFLGTLETVEFLGQTFAAPADQMGFLKFLYGATWNVPIRGTTSRISWFNRLKKVTSPSALVYYTRRFLGERSRKNQVRRQFEKGEDQ